MSIPAWLRRIIPAYTEAQRRAAIARLLKVGAPVRIVIDPALKPGQWYAVTAMHSPEDRAVHAAALATYAHPQFAPTTVEPPRLTHEAPQ